MHQRKTPTSEQLAGRRLMGLRTHAGSALSLAIAAPLAAGVLLVVQAALLANILGQTIENGAPLASVVPMLVAIAVIIALRAAIGLGGEIAGQAGAERIKLAVREKLFGHVVGNIHPMGLAPASGVVSAAVIDQVEALESFFARYLPAMIAASILPIAFGVILFPIDWIIALLFLFSAPLIPVFMALAGMGAQAATDRQANALARLSGHFADRLRGLTTLKLLDRADAATEEVFAASEDLRRRTNTVLRIAFLSSAILEFFAALGVAGVALYVGLTFLGFLSFHPELTLVSGLFALIMAPEVYQPLRQLAAHYHDRAAACSALGEIEAAVSRVDALAAAATGTAPQPLGRAIAVKARDLRVGIPGGSAVLEGLDLDIAPGQSVAIMGPSGIGKSTLARAMTRLVPYEGEIGLDGISLDQIDDATLRRSVTFITQRPRIMHGTIAENIAFARPQASRAQVQDAAQKASVSAFAADLPDGIDTLVGEGGFGLSGGQIQRVALARLFLTDPGLIILDEPTAHLDAETEAQVLDAIFGFAQGRTLLVLTHARAVAERCDRVLRLAGGRLHPIPQRRNALATGQREVRT